MENNPHPVEAISDPRLEMLENIFGLHSPERTLGHTAVRASNRQAAYVLRMSELGDETEQYIQPRKVSSQVLSQKYDLDDSRAKIWSLVGNDTGMNTLLQDYCTLNLPTYMVGMMAERAQKQGGAQSWGEWLVKTASDDELLNVLQWHNFNIEQQQTSEKVDRAFEWHKELFIEVANEFYEDGIISKPQKNIADIKLVVGDVFDTLLKERIGYAPIGVPEVVLQQGEGLFTHDTRVNKLIDSFSRVLTHEFVHAFLCTSFEANESAISSRWINEALTEELSRGFRMRYGIEQKNETAYTPERMLLRKIIDSSENAEDNWKLALHAFTGTDDDRVVFTNRVDVIWKATDVLEKITADIAAEEQKIVRLGRRMDRSVEIEAITQVHWKLETNPEGLLRGEVDTIVENIEVAALE